MQRKSKSNSDRRPARYTRAATQRAAREIRGAGFDIAQSAEAKRARVRARAALDALAKAASAAGALVRAAWRASGSHARTFGRSREARALRTSAQRAARTAAAAARAAGVKAGRGGAQAWNRAVSAGGRLRAAAKRKLSGARKIIGPDGAREV